MSEYVYAGAPPSGPYNQLIRSGKWTRVKWRHLYRNTAKWKLDSDNATFIVPDKKNGPHIWTASATVAWDNRASNGSFLSDHRRKMRFMQEVKPFTFGFNVAESEVIYSSKAQSDDHGDYALSCQQLYLQPGFDPSATGHKFYCEVWQDSGQTVNIKKLGMAAPLFMIAGLANWG